MQVQYPTRHLREARRAVRRLSCQPGPYSHLSTVHPKARDAPWGAKRLREEQGMRNVIVVTGAGQIGQAIARRTGVGKHVLLADLRPDNTDAAAEVLGNAGYDARASS